MKLLVQHVGDTLFVFSESAKAEVEAQMEAKMRQGHAKYNQNGSREFIESNPIIDTTKSGSAAYTWDKTGNKVKHNRFRVKIDADRNITREFLGTSWKEF